MQPWTHAALDQVLNQLLQQTYPADRFEVLVADGRSSDGTRELVERKASTATVEICVVDNPAGWQSGCSKKIGPLRKRPRIEGRS
ncbi:MAG: glycosyltransferase [Acidobacteriaceae bacterium]